jgi:hypothetical protein
MFILKPHSIVDVITNSSSELFVMKENKDIEFIRELLSDLLSVHNKANDTNLSLDKILTIKRIKTIEEAKDILYISYVLWDEPLWITDYKNPVEKIDYTKLYPDHENAWNNLHERRKKQFNSYFTDDVTKQLIGTIVIRSNDDNSIPYIILNFIDWTFDCQRIHLG